MSVIIEVIIMTRGFIASCMLFSYFHLPWTENGGISRKKKNQTKNPNQYSMV